MAGKKINNISLKQKIDIISLVNTKKQTKSDICKKYKIDLSTVNRIVKKKSEIYNQIGQCNNITRKRQRLGHHAKVEDALFAWFNEGRQQKVVLSAQLLKEKAKEFGEKLNDPFIPSNGWFTRWCKRYSIKLGKRHGEAAAAEMERATALQQYINEICENTAMDNVFNADECALFYKALPNETYYTDEQKRNGMEIPKERLTLLFICNATGTYKRVFAIGKTKAPRCLNNKVSPVPYFSNTKAWMTAELWQQILSSVNIEMIERNQKIVLFVDNASCHKKVVDFQNIEVKYLPPNTTALIQPLDQGIIHAFKTKYRQHLVQKQLSALERGEKKEQFVKSVTIFDALQYVKRAWDAVTTQTITNCFKKGGLGHLVVDNEEQEQEFVDCGQYLEADTNADEYIHCDDDVPCYGQMTDDDIINVKSEDEDEIELATPTNIPSKTEAFKALHQLQLYCNHNNIPDMLLQKFEDELLKHTLKNVK